MSTNGKGGFGIDKSKAFNKAVAGSSLSQRPPSIAGKGLSQKQKSEMAAQAMKSASRQTGAFESRYAKK